PISQSSDSATIVLLPTNVAADTVVVVTAQDSVGQTASSSITVKPAPIFGSLVVKPNATTCGTNAICSGQTATAQVTVTGPGSAGIPNRQVTFEVVSGAFKDSCSTGFRIDYFIYGGTPPYRVTSTFPNAVTLVNSTVNVSGGSFQAVTNGACVDPLVFSILDATGLQTTATLTNIPGT